MMVPYADVVVVVVVYYLKTKSSLSKYFNF